jgi:uncharacterized membrane protein YdbT with pleckstrin-like domain
MEFSVRPVFIGWVTLLTQLPLQLFLTVWAGGFFGGMSEFAFQHKSWGPFLLFGGLVFFGMPLVTYIGKRFNYAQTEYKFSDDSLEFEEGFLALNKKKIMLRDVREVALQKGVLQRLHGLGNIYLGTPATGSSTASNTFTALGLGNVSGSGIIMRDIPNPDDTYERIMRLVEKTRAG